MKPASQQVTSQQVTIYDIRKKLFSLSRDFADYTNLSGKALKLLGKSIVITSQYTYNSLKSLVVSRKNHEKAQ